MRPQNIRVKRIGYALLPAEREAAKALEKTPLDRPFTIRLWRERSHEQNALYWRCLERVVEATGKWRTPEELHLALKVATGYVDKVRLVDGRLVLVPGSIAFDKMGQDEAQRYYDAALRILCEEIMGGCTVEELLQHAGVRKAA